MMLIEPMIDDAPMMCIAKMATSMPGPICIDSGAYSVQPAAGAPPGTKNEPTSSSAAGGSSQKLKLFMRANAMSGAPICSGIIQFAKPTNAGMIAPNTMISPCIVVNWLKNSGSTNCRPGLEQLGADASAPARRPTRNMVNENHRYSVPMSLWLVANSQRRQPCGCAWIVVRMVVPVRIVVGSAGWSKHCAHRDFAPVDSSSAAQLTCARSAGAAAAAGAVGRAGRGELLRLPPRTSPSDGWTSAGLVAPGVLGVGDHRGDVGVGQLLPRRHRAVGGAVQHDVDLLGLVVEHDRAAVERRERPGALAGRPGGRRRSWPRRPSRRARPARSAPRPCSDRRRRAAIAFFCSSTHFA